MSDQTMPELNVKKTRASNLGSAPTVANSTAGSPTLIGSEPPQRPLAEAKALLETLLHHKFYRGKQRIISPLTEHRLRTLLSWCDMKTPDPKWVESVLDTVTRELERRLDQDDELALARAKLNKFQVQAFLIRYADYTAGYLNKLRKQLKGNSRFMTSEDATVAEPTGPGEGSAREFFLSATACEIDDRLEAEEQAVKYHRETPTPLLDFFRKLCVFNMDADFDRVRLSISQYARRNRIAHRNFEELAKEGKWEELAEILTEDLCELKHASTVCEPLVEPLRKNIHDMAAKYFSAYEWNKAETKRSLAAWVPRPIEEIFPASSAPAPKEGNQTREMKIQKRKELKDAVKKAAEREAAEEKSEPAEAVDDCPWFEMYDDEPLEEAEGISQSSQDDEGKESEGNVQLRADVGVILYQQEVKDSEEGNERGDITKGNTEQNKDRVRKWLADTDKEWRRRSA
ncbi:hypothetical protein QBC46DRAFT_418584 [Diplogelasinospora grovesii]|uniref:Uncharacterized protein n=1 Tax=Diplogelasinospora grovesii TaxID=303347 RepID=A0AAN6N127_9PEZI|nr:hypothetical protein QBC46DRAFT_418584 [Diplogelasinospora grovesii]